MLVDPIQFQTTNICWDGTLVHWSQNLSTLHDDFLIWDYSSSNYGCTLAALSCFSLQVNQFVNAANLDLGMYQKY